METKIKGKAYRVGDNTKLLDVMPYRFKNPNQMDPKVLGPGAFADLDPGFAPKAIAGEYPVVIGGSNFGGGGKTIEDPIFALKGANVKVVIADSFARFFLRNAINNALPIIVCPGISSRVKTDDELDVDLQTSVIHNLTTGESFSPTPLSDTVLQIVAAGGLLPYIKRKLVAVP